MNIEIDPDRLRAAAETVGSNARLLHHATGEVVSGCASARAGCGQVADGGLAAALARLQGAWQPDVDGIAKELAATANVIQSIARMYGSADEEGKQALQ